MIRIKKYIFPLALVKILLFFLVLQLFFTSCEEDSMFYYDNLYSNGALFEIPVSFGDDKEVFNVGDTVYLEIIIENTSLYDQISQEMITVSDAVYEARFAFLDEMYNDVFPGTIILEANGLRKTDNYFSATFGHYFAQNSLLTSTPEEDVISFKAGFVFNTAGDYTLYFHNTPNQYISEGESDISYTNTDGKDTEASAIYLFDMDNKTNNYIPGEDAEINPLDWAAFDQGIKEFKIIDDQE